jgi:hypothetical protein
MLAILALGGCATTPKLGGSGFLTSEAGLTETATKGEQERARPMAAGELANIQCFAIAEPVINDKSLSDVQARALANDLERNLVTALSPIRPVMTAGQGCAVVKSAVTAVTKSDVVENLIFGLAIFPVLPSNGAVALEAEVTAPGDGRSLAALQWAKAGSPLSLFSGMSEIGQARGLTRDFGVRVGRLVMPPPAPSS